MTGAGELTLTRIRVYPLKGAAGFDLESARPDAFGLPGDRRWMLVRPDGVFLSQRNQPRLALIQVSPVTEWSGTERPVTEQPATELPAPEPPGAGGAHTGDTADAGTSIDTDSPTPSLRFQLRAPGMEPLLLEAGEDPEAEEMEVTLWGARARGRVVEGAGEWFSDFLRQECRLLHSAPGLERAVDPDFAPGHRTRFSDGFPLLLASEESLADLNRHLSRPSSMLRFRPNLVVRGGAAWEEDSWRVLETGGLRLALVKPCARCVVTTVDPGTAAQGPEPLKTLRWVRGWEGKAYFGQNAVCSGTGGFRVGGRVRIVEKGPPRPPLG